MYYTAGIFYLAPRSMFEICGSRAVWLFAFQEPFRRNICLPLYANASCRGAILTQYPTAVLTLCACTPPLDQVLQLWDFLLAFGVHLNVLCVIAQLLLMRDEVMASSRCILFALFVLWLLTLTI